MRFFFLYQMILVIVSNLKNFSFMPKKTKNPWKFKLTQIVSKSIHQSVSHTQSIVRSP